MSKYIIIAGGVYSGTGKGVSCASIAFLMKQRGHSVQCFKLDGYGNIDAGILSPREHGESIVTEDGIECDLDVGHYERIAGIEVSRKNICTSGAIYKELIEEQENGKYLGQTVQIIPHFTNKVQERFLEIGKEVEITICEIGGSVGDIESASFFEAIRQFKQKHHSEVIVGLVAPIIWVGTIKEFKTKPLQTAVKSLLSFGIQPDFLLCRVDRPVSAKILDKISNLTNVSRDAIFDAPDVDSIYEVPIQFYNRHVDDLLADKLHLKRNGCRIHKYRELVEKYMASENMSVIKIGIVGKYDNCEEAYLSLREAIYHAAVANNVKASISWISAGEVENEKYEKKNLEELQAMIVPGGFDQSGTAGKIKATKYARENKIPFLGICLGLQCSIIEFARNVCNLENANSTEFDKKTPFPVVHFVEGQENLTKKLATMRLGAYDCELTKDSLAFELYKKKIISERHRHRYEVNQNYLDQFEKNEFYVSGRNPESGLVEIMEIDRKIHPFFIGTQAHPEFKSKLTNPAPLFDGLIKAAVNRKNICST